MSTAFSQTRLLYSRKQAAKLLGLSLSTLDRLARTGKLRPTKLGRRVCFCIETLQSITRPQ
jgi:excisionase family DNA binding protein